MSGSQTTFPFPTNLGTLPPRGQGSKVVSIRLDWATVLAAYKKYTAPINLLAQYQSGQFTTVQSLFIDNSTNIYPVSVTCLDSMYTTVCGPFSQGMFPLISEAAAQYEVTLDLIPFDTGSFVPAASTRLFFLNTPQKPFVVQNLLSNTNFLTINGYNPAWDAPFQVAPALLPSQHYAISAFQATILTATTFPAETLIVFALSDGVTSFQLWLDSRYVAPGAKGQIYSQETTFPVPSINPHGGNPLFLSASAYPPAGSYAVTYQISYNIVSVQ